MNLAHDNEELPDVTLPSGQVVPTLAVLQTLYAFAQKVEALCRTAEDTEAFESGVVQAVRESRPAVQAAELVLGIEAPAVNGDEEADAASLDGAS